MNRYDNAQVPRMRRHARHGAGFTLIELMIVVVIIAILATIAIPTYTSYVVKTHRVAAEGCLSEYANYMERYYTTNLRYDQDAAGTENALPDLDCASNNQTGNNYDYEFVGGTPTATTYTVAAVPKGAQARRDTACATLSIDQSGQRTRSGTATLDKCW